MPTTSIQMISPQDIHINPCTDVILDVRTPGEYAAMHLAGHHLFVPLNSFDPEQFLQRHGLDKDTTIYFLCATGNRAKKAAAKCAEAGLPNLYVIQGGIMAWQNAGVALAGATHAHNTSPSLSIERQVRIVAGAVVALAILAALLIHPYFIYLALFMGAGLVFSGITNFCGLALLLMKAPWNTKSSCGTDGSACPLKGSPGQSCQ